MTAALVLRLVAAAALLTPLLTPVLERTYVGAPDRRIVDMVTIGDADSEARHGYAGSEAITGRVSERSYRQTRGWLHYTLAIFEDTELAVACTFVRIDDASHDYEVVVEDSVVARRTLTATSHATNDAPVVVEIPVPLSLTRGKTSIAVVVRARGGLSPALHQLRSIQDHNELE